MAQTAALEERWWKSGGIKYGKTLVGRAHLVCSWFRVCCDETRIILRGIEGIKVRALNRWRHERRERREEARRILCQTALNTRDTGRVHSNASTQHSRDRLANKDRHFDPLTSRRVSDRCITFRPHAFTRYAEHLRRFDCFFFDMLIAFTFQRFSTWIINRALISCETFFFGDFGMEYFSRDTMTLKTKRVKEV